MRMILKGFVRLLIAIQAGGFLGFFTISRRCGAEWLLNLIAE